MSSQTQRANERIIHDTRCIEEGLHWLGQIEPKFAQAADEVGEIPLRLRSDGFDQVLSAIVSQQLSVSAAAAIWSRLKEAGFVTPEAINAGTDDELRHLGLSRQKCRYARALAAAEIDFVALRDRDTTEVIETLTQVSGVGVWTAEIYCMFSLGRADVFAPADLALQEAVRLLFDLEARPKPKELRLMSEAWSPWRAVAARLLWAYYKVAKQREGIA